MKITGYKRRISSSKEKTQVTNLCKWHTMKRNNARHESVWNFLILFSIIFERSYYNKTRIYYYGKGAINNKTTKKAVLIYTLCQYMKFIVSPNTRVTIFKLS